MAGWRGPPPQAPGHAAPRLGGLGLSRRCGGISCVAELGGPGRVCKAHAASIPPAPQAVGTCREVLEDVAAMDEAERFLVLDLSRPPGNPQDGRPSIGSLALRCHFW